MSHAKEGDIETYRRGKELICSACLLPSGLGKLPITQTGCCSSSTHGCRIKTLRLTPHFQPVCRGCDRALALHQTFCTHDRALVVLALFQSHQRPPRPGTTGCPMTIESSREESRPRSDVAPREAIRLNCFPLHTGCGTSFRLLRMAPWFARRSHELPQDVDLVPNPPAGDHSDCLI